MLLFMYNMCLACVHAHTINGIYSWKSVATSTSGSVMFILWMSTKGLKRKKKLSWNNQPWTCTFSIFSKEAWIPAFPSPTLAAHLHQDWLLVGTLSKGLHLLILLLSWPFFVFWTVSYPAHRNQNFTIQNLINGRERIFLHGCLVLISPNRP